jgi:hypothetical protein
MKAIPFLAATALVFAVALCGRAQPDVTKRPHGPAVIEILKLAEQLEAKDVAARAKTLVETHDSCDISQVFTLRRGGGAGIGSAAEAGHRDSIHHLVHDWAGAKPPTQAELKAHQKDLQRTARVLQAMAELAPYRLGQFGPMMKKKLEPEWGRVSAQFKSVTREFREAIGTMDPKETRRAVVNLQKTCAACHLLVGV